MLSFSWVFSDRWLIADKATYARSEMKINYIIFPSFRDQDEFRRVYIIVEIVCCYILGLVIKIIAKFCI